MLPAARESIIPSELKFSAKTTTAGPLSPRTCPRQPFPTPKLVGLARPALGSDAKVGAPGLEVLHSELPLPQLGLWDIRLTRRAGARRPALLTSLWVRTLLIQAPQFESWGWVGQGPCGGYWSGARCRLLHHMGRGNSTPKTSLLWTRPQMFPVPLSRLLAWLYGYVWVCVYV